MALRIVWTTEADLTYGNVILYLEKKWSEKEIRNFVTRVSEVLNLLSQNPQLYRRSKKKNIYQAVITKHTTLYYKLKNDSIDLLTFWDNRQSTDRLKIK